jgi:2-polyprenyl-3-methyl-5-hydroxy-6-metoxy-1,4-benzoquinol methylase
MEGLTNQSVAPAAPRQQFEKYDTLGGYHWRATYSGGWRRASPVLHGRYDAALRKLSELVDLRTSRGLDLGCGDGVLIYKVAGRGGEIIGVDGMTQALRIASEEMRVRRVRPKGLLCGSATDIPLKAESMDYVVSLEVIEHLPDPAPYLNEICRVLKERGVLVISTPTRRSSGLLHDVYHCCEYLPCELEELGRMYFSDARVFGIYPRVLAGVYERGCGLPPLDKLIRFGFKTSSWLGWNPFERCVTSAPNERWDGLLLVCRK